MAAYSIHFGSEAWSQVGSLPGPEFDALMETLEHYAERAATCRRADGTLEVLESVPIVAGSVIAECRIDDHERSVQVTGLERCEPFWLRAG